MPSRPSSIIVLGSVNTDLVIRAPRIPRPGETVLGGEFFQAAGGKGANQAVAAARAARDPVTFIAAVGDDEFGRQALAAFEKENLATGNIKVVAGEPSGVALIFVDAQGENSICVASGANTTLEPTDVDNVPEDVFAAARVFLACLESPPATVIHGLRHAKAANLQTILNPAPAEPAICDPDVLSLVDVLTPNLGEACALAGVPPDAPDAALNSARKLQQMGCHAVVVTLGSGGCLVVDENDVYEIPSRQVEAVDTTAAGDAFNGALAVALSEGRPLTEAVRWATAAAAIAVTRYGAQPSLARRAEIDELTSSWNENHPGATG